MPLSVNQHPFYRPLWRRVAIVASTVIWSGFELYYGDRFFSVIAVACMVYSIWSFLIVYKPTDIT